MEESERQRLERLRWLMDPQQNWLFKQNPRRQGPEPYSSPITPAPVVPQTRPIRKPLSVAQRLQGLHLGKQNDFTGWGTRSDPVVLNEPTYGDASARRNFSLPPLLSPISAAPPPGFRFRSRHGLPYLKRARRGDRSAPNLTAVDIKSLLSNIRPDEEIKVDQDATIPGLAPHIRLMRHQLVSPSSFRFNRRWD
jgi:hypothetical protein